jgi:hypothetical protein
MRCDPIQVCRTGLVAFWVLASVAAPCRGNEPRVLWEKAYDLPKQDFDERPYKVLGSYVETRFSPDGAVIAGGYRQC